MHLVKALKEEHAESVRLAVYHYALAAAWEGDRTALEVLSAFEAPTIERNRMGDILLRCARLEWRWKK